MMDTGYPSQKFTGKERDSESGLDYFGARYYGSSLGRFTSPDPAKLDIRHLLNPQKWNKYAYTINNPLRYFDPDGQEEVDIQLRAYIPQASVGPYRGDNRGPTTSQSVTSRTSITVRVETDPAKAQNPLIGTPVSRAGQTENLLTGAKATQTQGLPTAQVSRDGNGNVVANIQQNAANPLTTPQALTPGIRSDLTVTVPPNASSVSTAGTVSGSPAFELNVGRESGSDVNIPLQGASSNPVSFAAGLTENNSVLNFTVLPPPPPPQTKCSSGQRGCSQ